MYRTKSVFLVPVLFQQVFTAPRNLIILAQWQGTWMFFFGSKTGLSGCACITVPLLELHISQSEMEKKTLERYKIQLPFERERTDRMNANSNSLTYFRTEKLRKRSPYFLWCPALVTVFDIWLSKRKQREGKSSSENSVHLTSIMMMASWQQWTFWIWNCQPNWNTHVHHCALLVIYASLSGSVFGIMNFQLSTPVHVYIELSWDDASWWTKTVMWPQDKREILCFTACASNILPGEKGHNIAAFLSRKNCSICACFVFSCSNFPLDSLIQWKKGDMDAFISRKQREGKSSSENSVHLTSIMMMASWQQWIHCVRK